MTFSVDDLVVQVKQANRIEDVIGETPGYSVVGRGRYLTTREHDSLVIDTHNQAYWWNSTGEHGDVIEWGCKRNGWDFKRSVEHLCTRVNLPTPDWGKQDPAMRMVTRQREDALGAATDIFHKWLINSEKAMAYLHGRGLTDETIKRANLGYTGCRDNQDKSRAEMINAISGAGVDPRSPAAIAILGLRGGVKQWCSSYGIQPDLKWSDEDRIYGIIGWDRIYFPHIRNGRVGYFSLRSMEDRMHFNPPAELVGERQFYANPKWSTGESICVIVEGKMDALTLDQWDIPAIALNGVAADERIASAIGATKENKRAIFFLGLDSDKAGSLNHSKVARLLGPMTRIVTWEGTAGVDKYTDPDGKEIDAKDANAILQGAIQKGLETNDLVKQVGVRLNTSPTFAEKIAEWAGKQEGADRDDAIRQALNVIAGMDEVSRAQYQVQLAKLLQIQQRELTRMVKTLQDQAKKKDTDGENVVYTLGGFINGWLIEYLYNYQTHQVKLAWRDPSGNISSGESVSIDGVKYKAELPEEAYREKGILFPSELGPKKRVKELADLIEMYINDVYILPNELTGKIISYWVMVTWVYDCFDALPYLRAIGASGAGKSELLYRIGLVSYRLLVAGGADTVSTLFRSSERYRGTVLFDEGDLERSDAADERIKFLNFGAMRGHPIWRIEEVIGENGVKEYRSKMYRTYCPKLIGQRKDFRDDAVGNRSITFKVQERGMRELMARKIPLHVTEAIHQRAQLIRNALLRFRLETWQPEIEINMDYYELDISPRLNQVTGALMMVAKDDDQLREEMRSFMREYYLEMTQNKSMTIIARVIEAIWKIWKFPDLHKLMVVEEESGAKKILIGHVTKIANEIIDTMNSTDEDDGGGDEQQKYRKDELSPHKIGRLIRDDMQLQVSRRTNKGFYVYFDENRMKEISISYGIDPEEFGPIEKKTTPSEKQLGLGDVYAD